jgi:hypothetical protein
LLSGLSRRAFLGGAASLAAVVVLPLATAERAAALGGRPPVAPKARGSVGAAGGLQRSTFLPLLRSSFQMTDDRGRSVAVVLSKVSDLSPAVKPAEQNRFSLLFDGPLAQPWPQRTYHFHHPAIGTVDLFAVPVDRPVSVRHYQAIISHNG